MSKNRFLVVGASIVIFYVLIGLLAPVLAPPAPNSDPFVIPQDLEIYVFTTAPTPPTFQHIFGTTDRQYDLYYGCIWGTQMALRIGVLVMLYALTIGLPFGVLAGYFGGFVDEALSWFINIFLALSPILALGMIIALPTEVSLGLSFTVTFSRMDRLMVALILTGWPISANIVRSGVLRIRGETLFEEPTVIKVAEWRGWKQYCALVLHAACLQLAFTVLFAAGISFLGLGSAPDYADWGNLIQSARALISQPTALLQYWHTYAFPGLFLTTFVLGWILLGEGFTRIIEDGMEKVRAS
jgi:peptide/nickel transport system permease protein